MNSYPPNHPIWKLLRLVVVGVILLGCLAFVYAGLDQRDMLTLIITLMGLGGYDALKAKITRPGDKDSHEDETNDT